MDERSLIEYVPFATLVTGVVKESPLLTGIVEKLVISIVGAGIALYANNIAMSKDIEQMRSTMKDIKEDVQRIDNRVYNLQVQINRQYIEGRVRKSSE